MQRGIVEDPVHVGVKGLAERGLGVELVSGGAHGAARLQVG